MSEPFLGEVRCYGFLFAPRNWAKCDGQLLPINQNQALFALLGTTYGGDGQTVFALPELRGRAPIHHGQGPGLPNFPQGTRSGAVSTTLNVSNLPSHTHSATLRASDANSDQVMPEGNALAVAREDTYVDEDTSVPMRAGSIQVGSTGNGSSFNNMQPYLALNWCIALTGIFPSQF